MIGQALRGAVPTENGLLVGGGVGVGSGVL